MTTILIVRRHHVLEYCAIKMAAFNYDRERFGFGRGSPLYGDPGSAEARERALRSVFSKD